VILLLCLGTTLGLLNIPLASYSIYILGCILFFALLLIFRWAIPKKVTGLLFYAAVFLGAWAASSYIQQNLTLPIANSIGTACLILFLFYMSSCNILQPGSDKKHGIIIFGYGVALLTIIWRLVEYYNWFNNEIISEFAMGFLRVPILSIILLILTIMIWPRKRKIHRHLKINISKPFLHWVLLVSAFLLIPHGILRTENPFFKAGAMGENQARHVMQQVLSSTYKAFNIDNADLLYKELEKSVSDDLIADVYLDSRRRLTAGVRQGAEVKVKNVSIISIGDIISGNNPNDGYSYKSKWTVTARVRHLQHIHHRRNIYTGILKVKIEDDKWKIAAIELISEDREIIPGSSG
jgi:hypothetical protein